MFKEVGKAYDDAKDAKHTYDKASKSYNKAEKAYNNAMGEDDFKRDNHDDNEKIPEQSSVGIKDDGENKKDEPKASSGFFDYLKDGAKWGTD